MKDFLLKTKFLGVALVLIYALVLASLATPTINNLIRTSVPQAAQEIKYFLPITIENGVIVSPENTVLERDFDANGQKVRIVLDTRVDEFAATNLTETGIFISKKYLYAISPQKTEIRSLSQMPNMMIDDEVVDQFADQLVQKSSKWMFVSIFFGLLIFVSVAILLYTLLLAWPMAAWAKVSFAQTLRVTTIAYVLLAAVSYVLSFNFSIIATLVILAVSNVAVVKSAQI